MNYVMDQIFRFETIAEYNAFNNHETLHPLVSVIDFSKANPRSWGGRKNVRIYYGFYCVFLKDIVGCNLKYGRNYYDYQEGTLVFVAPGQILEIETDGQVYQPKGFALVFHSDLLYGTPLAKSIGDYHFFSYNVHEALHLSERERKIVLNSLAKIESELHQNIDKHSKKLIALNIELFLSYCDRFYDRQFITRDNVNRGILEKFEELLNNYFSSDKPGKLGLPSVSYFADELHLSANYFGDLIKKKTGKTAKEYIQNKIIEAAKTRIFDSGKTINEIAYELGFKYPQHFTRMFKNHTGYTPCQYRLSN